MAITISRPSVNGSNNTWGTTINTGLEALESTLNGTGTGKVKIEPDLTGGSWQIDGTAVDASAAELNLLDGAAGATVVDGKAVVYGDAGEMLVNQVFEKVDTQTSTTGTINFDVNSQAVQFYTANQTANRTINFRGDSSTSLNDTLAIGQSTTVAIMMTQGSTAYYLNTYQIDGTSVTPKWQFGESPSEGNASGIDVYTFTIIKTASATYTVLGSLAQFA
jgi:hypothetical protein